MGRVSDRGTGSVNGLGSRDWLNIVLALTLVVVVVGSAIDRRTQLRQAHAADVASCTRGNVIRLNQRIILDVLLVATERFQVTDPDPAVRLFLRNQRPVLQAARDRIAVIDCEHPPPIEETPR